MRLIALAAVVLTVGLAWPAVAQVAAPGPVPGPTPSAPGPAPSAPGAGPGRMGRFDPAQMLNMLAQRLGLTDAEKAVTEKALRAKMEASTNLSRELEALSEVARNEKSTDKDLGAALKRYDAALAAYRQRTQAIDAQLGKAVSLKARAGLTAAGIIDNGFGMRFGGMRPGAGGERPAGGRGFGGGAGAPAPGPQANP